MDGVGVLEIEVWIGFPLGSRLACMVAWATVGLGLDGIFKSDYPHGLILDSKSSYSRGSTASLFFSEILGMCTKVKCFHSHSLACLYFSSLLPFFTLSTAPHCSNEPHCEMPLS